LCITSFTVFRPNSARFVLLFGYALFISMNSINRVVFVVGEWAFYCEADLIFVNIVKGSGSEEFNKLDLNEITDSRIDI
jgi:hypothetical protein